MHSKKVLQHNASMDAFSTRSNTHQSKFEKKTDYATLQRPKSNLVFYEKDISPKKSEEAEENRSFFNTPSSHKYKIFFLMKNETVPLDVDCRFPAEYSVKEAIRHVLKVFNQELKQRGHSFILSENSLFWELRFAKKTGLPKNDYPALDDSNPIYNIGSTSLSLCCKDYTNGILIDSDNSPSNCGIPTENERKTTAVSNFSRCYENSLTLSRNNEVFVRRRDREIKPNTPKKTKSWLFTLFCI